MRLKAHMSCQSCLKAYHFPSLHTQIVLSTEMSNTRGKAFTHLRCHSQVLVSYLKIWSVLMLRISQTLSRILGTMCWLHWSPGINGVWNWWHRADAAVAHLGCWLPCTRFSGPGMCWSAGLQHLPSRSCASHNSTTATPNTNATISGEKTSIISSDLSSLRNLEERCWYHAWGLVQDILNRSNTQQNPAWEQGKGSSCKKASWLLGLSYILDHIGEV